MVSGSGGVGETDCKWGIKELPGRRKCTLLGGFGYIHVYICQKSSTEDISLLLYTDYALIKLPFSKGKSTW